MAFFGVTLETIEKIWPHPNADRLEMAKLKGMDFQFVVGKGLNKEGAEVIYFPVDSLLPNDIQEKMGVLGKLSGTQKNRIKTITLRGAISQGMIGPKDMVPLEILEQGTEAITKYLGVTKYEPPQKFSSTAQLLELPDGATDYDIEGADRYVDVANILMDLPCSISEKIEGSNFSCTVSKDGKFYVNQHHNTIVELEGKENTYCKVARTLQLEEKLTKSINHLLPITLYGELIGPGIQGNIYGLKEHTVLFFDILGQYKWASAEVKQALFELLELKTVPILASNVTLREWLSGKTIREASNGKSVLNTNSDREGVVITPMAEQRLPNFGRLIIKQRSPLYLAKSEN